MIDLADAAEAVNLRLLKFTVPTRIPLQRSQGKVERSSLVRNVEIPSDGLATIVGDIPQTGG